MNTEQAQLLSHRNESKQYTKKYIIITCVILIVVAGLSAGIGYYIGTLQNKDSFSNEYNIVDSYDIAIIGGGASGLYQAYNLQQNYPESTIKIFEKLSRIGGRQFSSHLHVVDEDDNILRSINFENVAMRFWPSHNLTIQLISHLDLCDDITPFGYNPLEIPNYFRNSFVSNGNYQNIYNVSSNELIYFNESFWDGIFDEIIEENGNIIPETLNDWKVFRGNYTYKGKPLYEWSSTCVFSVKNISTELESYLFRIGSKIATPLHSVSLIFESFLQSKYEIDTNRSSHKMWTLNNGYDSMVRKLYELIGMEDTVLLNHKVTAINKYKDNDYLIEINDGQYYYKSNKIILSVPPLSMKKLMETSPLLNVDTMNQLIDSKFIIFNAKINLIFDDTFLINNSIESFVPASTDLVLSEFYIEDSQRNDTLYCLHVYIYNKHLPLIYNLQQIGNDYTIATNIKLENENDLQTGLEIASDLVVDRVMYDLSTYTSTDNIPYPKAAFIVFIGDDDSFHISGSSRPKAGYNVEEIIEKQYNPINGEDIFIAIGDFQIDGTFMEDVLHNGNENLLRNFDIENPLENEEYCSFPL